MRKTLCAYPGCRQICNGGRCDVHRRPAREDRPKVRDPFLDTQAWRQLSAAVAARDPLCAGCKRKGLIVIGTQRDHVVPRKERPDLALVAENIENLCDRCHAKKTRRGK
jgi:5-methylcytosine-specific restriction protein A